MEKTWKAVGQYLRAAKPDPIRVHSYAKWFLCPSAVHLPEAAAGGRMPSSMSFDQARYSFLISVPNRRYKNTTAVIPWFSVVAQMNGGWVWRQIPLPRVLQLLIRLGEAAAGSVGYSCFLCTCWENKFPSLQISYVLWDQIPLGKKKLR